MKKYDDVFEFGKNGWFDFKEIYDMVVEKYKDGVFLEIGCWQGMSSAYMLEKAKLENNNISFYCLDIFLGDKDNEGEQRIIKTLDDSLENIFKKNLLSLGYTENKDYQIIKEYSDIGHERFSDEFFDFIFVDGGHLYDQVCRDIDCWTPKVKKSGIISGHDYDAPGVYKAVNEKFKNIEVINGNSWLVNI